MQQLTLSASKRDGGHAGRLRARGKLPAVVYGHSASATALALDQHDFVRVFSRAGRTHLVDLVVDGGRAQKVLVREVQTHPRRIGPIHVDFYRVSLKEKLQADVPVVTSGEAPAVRLGLGDLLHVVHTLRVECLPSDIPETIEADLSGLNNVDEAIRVADLQLPANVVVVADPEEVVVKITAKREMEAEPLAEAVSAPTEEGAEAVSAEGAAGDSA